MPRRTSRPGHAYSTALRLLRMLSHGDLGRKYAYGALNMPSNMAGIRGDGNTRRVIAMLQDVFRTQGPKTKTLKGHSTRRRPTAPNWPESRFAVQNAAVLGVAGWTLGGCMLPWDPLWRNSQPLIRKEGPRTSLLQLRHRL